MKSKYLITAVMVVAAIAVSILFYQRYHARPWTRDGQVRANVVGVAPRVSGPVVQIPVRDNQEVKKGDLLFEIDPATYLAAVAESKARVEQTQAAAKKAGQELTRQNELMKSNATDTQTLQNAQDDKLAADANLAAALAELQTSELNLSYTKVFAPVDGYLTNVNTSVGTYVEAGGQLLALVDAGSFWIAAYFVETNLKNVTPGLKAKITFMGHEWSPVEATIESVGWGIFLSDGATVNLLPQVSQTVDWVRLPNRFPVRVKLTGRPPAPLRIGQTVSVALE